MDKINALLVGIICILTAVSVYIIWDTCFRDQPYAEGELAMGHAVIAMNDEGCAINGGSEAMWFRIRQAGEEEWTYSEETVSPGSMSEQLLCVEKEAGPVYVEGIQTNWVDLSVKDGKAAFVKCEEQPLRHYKASFL